MSQQHIGVYGMAVMGSNLALNIEKVVVTLSLFSIVLVKRRKK